MAKQLADISLFPQTQRRTIYLALDDMNFTWFRKEVYLIRDLWKQGHDFVDIAEAVSRDPDEMFLLLADQAYSGMIEARPGGLSGTISGELELIPLSKRKGSGQTYICFLKADMVWDEKCMPQVDRNWEEGLSLPDMARALGRPMIETMMLIMDRARKGFIKDRPGGWMGRRRRI